MVGIESCRRGFVDVGAIGKIFGVYRQALTEGDQAGGGEAVDLIRESVRTVLQEVIEAEAAEFIGATRYERSESRTNERYGFSATDAGHEGR
jgi:transposase-like protein